MRASARHDPPTKNNRLFLGLKDLAKSDNSDFINARRSFFLLISINFKGPSSELAHFPTWPLLISASSSDVPPRSHTNPYAPGQPVSTP